MQCARVYACTFCRAPVVIAYRFTDAELIVLRVFHGRQDYLSALAIEE